MKVRFDPSRPIYLQIIEEIQRQIATGNLRPGDKLPSQRDLAAVMQVNANTVQRAYRDMELLGIVETLRGQGTFVRNDQQIVEEMRGDMVNALVEEFVTAMRALGYDEAAILAHVQAKLGAERENGGDRDGK